MGFMIQQYGDKSGPLLLFLHGGGVSSWMWEKQVDYFTNYHVATVDLPEHGESKHIHPFKIKTAAEQLLKQIEQLAHGKRNIVVGFSLGAQILVKMLSMRPDVIDDAIINSALVKPSRWISKIIGQIGRASCRE